MTYKELKKKQNKIKELRLDIADIKSSAEKITQSISGVPASSGVSDKVGNNATRIVHIENQIKEAKLKDATGNEGGDVPKERTVDDIMAEAVNRMRTGK